MPTTYVWNGTVNDAWDTAANWTPTATGGILTGDTVEIPLSAPNNLKTNLSRIGDPYPGALLGLNLAAFRRAENSTVKIGTTGNPLKLTADLFHDEGDTDLYFESNTGTAQQPTDRLIINPTNPAAVISVGGKQLTGGIASITRGELLAGNVTLSILTAGDILIADAYFVPLNQFYLNVAVSNEPRITYPYIGGGTISLTDFVEARQYGGDLTAKSFTVGISTAKLYQFGGVALVTRSLPQLQVLRALCRVEGVPGTYAVITKLIIGPDGQFTRNVFSTIVESTITLGVE